MKFKTKGGAVITASEYLGTLHGTINGHGETVDFAISTNDLEKLTEETITDVLLTIAKLEIYWNDTRMVNWCFDTKTKNGLLVEDIVWNNELDFVMCGVYF